LQNVVGAGFGAAVDLSQIKSQKRADLTFFSETAGCFLAEVQNEKIAEGLFSNLPHAFLGKTLDSDQIEVKSGSDVWQK